MDDALSIEGCILRFFTPGSHCHLDPVLWQTMTLDIGSEFYPDDANVSKRYWKKYIEDNGEEFETLYIA